MPPLSNNISAQEAVRGQKAARQARPQHKKWASMTVVFAVAALCVLASAVPVGANPKPGHSKVHHNIPAPHPHAHHAIPVHNSKSHARHGVPPPVVHNPKIEAQMKASGAHAVSPRLQKQETVVEAPQVHQRVPAKEYRGPLKTKEVEGRLICETPECSMAASQIISSMNTSVNPCDDFFTFACGQYISQHPAPPTSSSFGDAANLMTQRLRLILETPAEATDPEPLFMIRRMYQSCMDTDGMDALGLAPLTEALSAFGGWPMVDPSWSESSYSTEQSLALIRDLNFGPALGMAIESDLFDTSIKRLYIGEGTTGINEFILANLADYPIEMAAYRRFIGDSAKQVRDFLASGVTDEEIDAEVETLIQFEMQLAQLMQASGVEEGEQVLELMTVQQLQAIADNPTPGAFDYLTFLQLIFAGSGITITADEPVYLDGGESYVSGFATLLQNTPTRTLANYMAWMYTFDIGGTQTTYAMRNITYDFLTIYAGITGPPERWYYCTELVNIDLGFPLSRAYVDEFFPAGAKEENEIMVEDIRAAFDSLLDVNDWLTAEDIASSKEKLAAIEPFVAYPDWIDDDAQLTAAYAGLEIDAGQQFNNLVNIGQYIELYDCETYRDPPAPSFLMPPTIVNAFYDPLTNSITILAGILQIPFYQHNSLAALNYGGIGMVIGHELTHGFDNSGRQFDKDGNLAEWMTQESIDAFDVRAQCFVDQYNAFHPPEVADPTVTVDGAQTLGENIADNGGIREAFQAYQIYVERNGVEPSLPGLDEFTPDQLFYLGNANVWCESKDSAAIMSQLSSDVHSPGRFRILGPFSNDAEFSRVWNCPAGSPMNRGEDSCVLW